MTFNMKRIKTDRPAPLGFDWVIDWDGEWVVTVYHEHQATIAMARCEELGDPTKLQARGKSFGAEMLRGLYRGMRVVECPWCSAPIDSDCKRPSGRQQWGSESHAQRRKLYDEWLMKQVGGE